MFFVREAVAVVVSNARENNARVVVVDVNDDVNDDDDDISIL